MSILTGETLWRAATSGLSSLRAYDVIDPPGPASRMPGACALRRKEARVGECVGNATWEVRDSLGEEGTA